jgi:DNA-binding protein HU-beta
MSNELLRLNKGLTTAKLQLSLFTTSLDDNRDLGARVAHLETEFAGVAMAYGRTGEAFHAFVAAAAAYRELGNLRASAGCLERCRGIGTGDSEMNSLLVQAIADLKKLLAPIPAPKKKAPTPKKKAPTPKKKAPTPEVPASEAKAPAPKKKAPAPEAKVSAPKKKAPVSGTRVSEAKERVLETKAVTGKKKANKDSK